MMTHKESEALFAKCRDKEKGYRFANNTRIQKRGRAFAIRLHETDIVMIRPDGAYRLNSGGWKTVTTKERMNRILPCDVWQRNGLWFVGDSYYEDGMLIGSDGMVIGDTKPIEHVLGIKKRVDYYCCKFVQLATITCMGQEIGNWESHHNYALPRKYWSKPHLIKLWNDITSATREQPTEWKDDSSRFFKWVYLSIMARGHCDPRLIWELIQKDCINCHKSQWIIDNLKSFMRPRKTLIVDLIMSGDLKV